MKGKRVFVLLAIMMLWLCSVAMADDLTIVTRDGHVYTYNETDLTITGRVSLYDFGKTIECAAANRSNGEVVLGFRDGTAVVVKYNALGTILTSGTISNGSALLGVAVRPNGDLYFANYEGWAYARSQTDVTAVPAGYTLPADLRFMSGANPYLYVVTSPQDKVVFVAADRKETWIRQGSDMNSVPPGYVNDHLVWDGILTAQCTLSTGDVVLAQMGPTPSAGAKVFVRDDANMAALPAGYVGDAGNISGVTLGNGSRTKAMARTADDLLLIGNDGAELFLRPANNLQATTIPGYASTQTGGWSWGTSALAVTSTNNVAIGLYNGEVYVRSVFDIDGDDITSPNNFLNEVIAIFPMPHVETGLTCEQIISQGNVLLGDFNRDCYVDFEDVAEFALDWTKCNDPENENCVW